MNYKLFLQILLIFAIISTIFICVKKPQMHKSVMIYNSDFEIVTGDDYNQETVQNIPTVEQSAVSTPKTIEVVTFEDFKSEFPKNIQTTVKNNDAQTQKVTFTNKTLIPATTVQYQNQTVQNSPKTTSVRQVAVSSPASKVVVNTPQLEQVQTKSESPKTVYTTQKIVNAPTPVTTQTTSAPMPKVTVAVRNPTQSTIQTKSGANSEPVTYLTEKEEEIAWNIWRSNLQNKIMSDVRLPNVPSGTVFRFSFTVDKYGKVTNVQTRSDDSRYTPYAIQYIAPVIRSYQGRDILTFPKGSKRVITDVKGAWKISGSTKYSTPQDYNDVERIKN